MDAEDEQRRRRLYRPGSTSADVEAYLRLVATVPVAAPRPRRARSLAPATTAAALIAAAVLLLAAGHRDGVRAAAVLDAEDGSRAVGLLEAGGGPGRLAPAVLGPMGLTGTPFVTVLQAGGSGPSDVPLGALGSVTQGRRVRVIVVTDGSYALRLRDGGRTVALVTGDGGVTAADVDLPSVAAHARVSMDVPAGRRFACFVATNG